jgi:HD-like signal output (HDOD) protein
MDATIINKKEINKKIDQNEPIEVSFKYVDEQLLIDFNSIISKLLANKDQIYLLNSIVTIFREIIVNAIKANGKRVYFLKSHLNINNADDYKKGMENFRNDVVGDLKLLEADLSRSDFYVNVVFCSDGDKISIVVTNNSPIHSVELERINFRIQKANQYNDFTEAYEEIEDDTEGAGLGIVLTILLLKNMGIASSNYSILTDNKITTTSLTIPRELRPLSVTTNIKEKILNDIEGIPTFPENIIELQRICMNQDSTIDQISSRLTKDPALTTDVIKLSNSAAIVPGKRITDIKTAVVTIGLKNLNGILTASNARRILNERYSSFEQIWEHCNRVAFYAKNIAVYNRASKIAEASYMSGLLHDLGKIVLLATDKKLVNHIADMVENRKISTTTIMEEISIGVSHSTIGSLIATKWNFPEYLVEAIKMHHSPLSSKKENIEVNCVVYTANMMVGIEDRKYHFYYIEEEVLNMVKLADKNQFMDFHKQIKEVYDSHKKLLN